MKKTQFIPDLVGFSVTNDRYKDLPTASPVPMSNVKEVQKLINKTIYFNGSIKYKNTPTKGYHAMLVGEKLELCHPDGYTITVTEYNLGVIIREGNLNNGMIEDELVFAFDSTFREFLLLPYGKDTYNEIKKQSDEYFAAKSGETKLEPGCNVVFDGCEFEYLGEVYYAVLKYDRYEYTMGIIVAKRMVMKKDDQYLIMPPRKPDSITAGNGPVLSTDEVADICRNDNKIRYIRKFNKNGHYNSCQFGDVHLVSSKKITKADVEIKYVKTSKTHLYHFPLFRDTNGELFLQVERERFSSYRNYSTSWTLDSKNLGTKVNGVPYNESTHSPDLTIDRSRVTFNNVVEVKTKEILTPILEMK
ncbi:hypothetical protein XaC1_146 [Xanthomonas phage XaC1]|nr:hypothetical protein XaC1_146 [Xanthomonas phage XaC1]